ncbi:hypothetical protein [Salibacterium halotolerans]|uniref:Uncharacterized protein n=1 Tax=Salibacterium halotolerans TaxID=1884432 RepID=A0A1I5MMV9_9BACI|nr:hypothetical protein [Salibacterium halotolerans]SFP10276.1 hypothetical protein SAMN05518683_102272 [Salibacterium halotolerans]
MTIKKKEWDRWQGITDEINAENAVLRNIKERLDKQTKKDLEKYGKTVNPDDYSVTGWIEHAQDELIDALVYLETLKQKEWLDELPRKKL